MRMGGKLRKTFVHEIIVDRPLAAAVQLFTPKGEEAWVPGWRPRYLAPQTGETQEEMLFTTGEGAETTYWTCLKWSPDDGHARYLRLTPSTRVAFVDVRCTSDGDTQTRVRVTYEMHALTQAGAVELEAFDEATFTAMIAEWSQLICERT